ncbi:deoxyribose-phosphate aldolase [Rheinheimera mesophila]|uniref:Deoxyribose-phosphate aldolase n=1 Tax=Rheinheimera mesophila TaxID=1547515 RepID=A0A3P3QRD2_9GAMM|nr:deoxyribose-phosphate aldolase [Rheinheimera mesophila]KKL02288.1 deoxyribose-phosphate aldolase [Rheinheimera mesophila]RRJ23000.1 deoxyribose-phosphate aldolase [Rheinheimera mesophila]
MTNPLRIQQLMKLVDLTRLQDQDDALAMQQWLEQDLAGAAVLPAAICVYPQYLTQVKDFLQKQNYAIKLATVVNFPTGSLPLEQVLQQISTALAAGADEIDCVLPYQTLLSGQVQQVRHFLAAVRQATAGVCLKIIIESGELVTCQQISKATELVVESGADFVKSSTGKVKVGVTEEAARIMLAVLAASDRAVGFKASGGVRTVEFALKLVNLFEEVTGEVATAQGMRLGASALLNDLTQQLDY